MKKSIQLKKNFINNDNIIVFRCPKCNLTKEISIPINVSDDKRLKYINRIRINCSCGHPHIISLERRKFFRKKVNLPGVYMLEHGKVRRPMIIRDISRSGLRCDLRIRGDMETGQKIWVEFHPNNEACILIKKEAMIKNISGITIGVEFCHMERGGYFESIYDMAALYTFPRQFWVILP